MPKALLVKFGAIGDAIMLLPAAHALHQAGHTIDWVCGPELLPILKLYPWIRPIVVDDRAILRGSFLRRIRAILALWRTLLPLGSYDLAATLYYDPRYRLLTLPVRAARKFQLTETGRRYRLLPGRHHTDEYARILLDLPDTVRPQALAPVRPEVMPASPRPRTARARVLLAPAGAKNMLADDALRRWAAEDYVVLARLLLAENLDVTLIGGPGDAWVQPLFNEVAQEGSITDLIGRLTLVETLGLLDDSDLLVTHDTGPLHMAGLTRIAIVSLFGPTDPHGRLPQRPNALALWGGESFACRPCYDGHSFAPCTRNDCIRQFTPATVAAHVMALLAVRGLGQSLPPRVVTETQANP